jgi:hypothetical protein
VEKEVQSEDEEQKAQKSAGDVGDEFHVLCLLWIVSVTV